MTSKFFFASALLSLPFTLISASAFASPAKVPAIYDRVYVPEGFDSNDHIQIVGTGKFESSCYRPAETTVTVDKEKKRISVGPAAYKYPGFCLQIITDFDRVIDVGVLPAGEYDIVQKGNFTSLGKLNVARAVTDSPDDYLYAPVSQAYVDDDGKPSDLTIKGVFPSSCMSLEDVKLQMANDVIVAQPIVKLERTPDCALGYFPYKKSVKVNVTKGKYLLHIRSANAKAINNIVDVN